MSDVGRMNERIRILRMQPKQDERTGQVTPEPNEFAQLWAEWKQVDGEEIETAADRVAIVRDTFRIRWRPDVETQMQVVHRERTLTIAAALEIERQTWLLLKCVGVA